MTEVKHNKNDQRTVFICQGTGCVSGKSIEITEALAKAAAEQGLSGIKIDFTGCHGFCQQGPIVVIEPEGIFYTGVKEEDAPEVVKSSFIEKPFDRFAVAQMGCHYFRDIGNGDVCVENSLRFDDCHRALFAETVTAGEIYFNTAQALFRGGFG